MHDHGFVKLRRTEPTRELLSDPLAMHLLTVIAYRARFTREPSLVGLTFGQAFIGDSHAYGLTRKQDVCARRRLARMGLVTFQTIPGRGTIATLCDSRVFSLTDERPKRGHHEGHLGGQPFSEVKPPNGNTFGAGDESTFGASQGQQGDHNQKDRTGKNVKNDDQAYGTGVTAIYEAYPRKQKKIKAIEAIERAIKAGHSLERLLERTQAYATATAAWSEADRQFIPHPASWFNAGSYDDDPATWARHSAGNNRVGQITPDDHAKGF